MFSFTDFLFNICHPPSITTQSLLEASLCLPCTSMTWGQEINRQLTSVNIKTTMQQSQRGRTWEHS